jgi:hypothetical protein
MDLAERDKLLGSLQKKNAYICIVGTYVRSSLWDSSSASEAFSATVHTNI